MRVIKTDDVGMVFFAGEHPTAVERNAGRLTVGRSHAVAHAKTASGAIPPAPNSVRLPSSSRIRPAILFLRHAGIIISDANHAAAVFRLVEHSHQAGEIELLVLAAQANSSHLDGEVLLAYGRDEALPPNKISDTEAFATFKVIDEPGAGMAEILL